jgi:hypothetical protein
VIGKKKQKRDSMDKIEDKFIYSLYWFSIFRSFGVVLWEIYTLAKQPYFGHNNEEVWKINVVNSNFDFLF